MLPKARFATSLDCSPSALPGSNASRSLRRQKRCNAPSNNTLEQNSRQMIEDRRAVHGDRAVCGQTVGASDTFSDKCRATTTLGSAHRLYSARTVPLNHLLLLLLRDLSRSVRIQSSGPAFALSMDRAKGMLRFA